MPHEAGDPVRAVKWLEEMKRQEIRPRGDLESWDERL